MTEENKDPQVDIPTVAALIDTAPILDEVDAAMSGISGMVEETKKDLSQDASIPEVVEKTVEPVETPSSTPVTDGRKAHKAFQEFSITSKDPLDSGDELTLPAAFDKETRTIIANVPNINIVGTPEAREWAEAVSDGLGYSTFAETFVPTLEDEQAEFRQQLSHNNSSLNAAVPKHKAITNEELKSERALIRLTTHLGLGTLFQVPLWHSGFWITFKPPTESEILELNRQLSSDKIQFGRQTYGLAFSNVTSYTMDRLIGFALSHVYDMTAKVEDINMGNLRDHISSQDIPSLLWGFVCTMYPRGFKYRRACVADPEKCNYILEETLNVFKLQWTNNVALTEWQRTHMSIRQSKSKDLASITRYKEELTRIQKTKIDINKDTPTAISITIKTPSVREYIDAGHRWIGDIVNIVDRALGAEAGDRERNALILQYGQASSMRQYSHWIDSIEFETNVIKELETIETVLDTLSADDNVRTEFIEAVVSFINKSTISIIGIPVFKCPSCQKDNESHFKLPAYANVIPLDMIQVFFGLLTQRLERVAAR